MWGEHDPISKNGYGIKHIEANRNAKNKIDGTNFVKNELPRTIKEGNIIIDTKNPMNRYIVDNNNLVSIPNTWSGNAVNADRNWVLTSHPLSKQQNIAINNLYNNSTNQMQNNAVQVQRFQLPVHNLKTAINNIKMDAYHNLLKFWNKR